MAWREDLHVSATAARFAVCMYYAKAEAFGLAVPAWEAAPVAERREFLQRAVDLLEELRPAERRGFDYMGLVIGAITPSQPWGTR